MKVKELIEKLSQYNENAEVIITVNSQKTEFGLGFGGDDGVTKETTKSVIFYSLNQPFDIQDQNKEAV